jgi:prolipoprotein diacylglyceryl transferase
VPAGVIGARLYHVITDWQRFEDAPLDAFKIWEGGLGIPGGMAIGVAVGVWVGHRRGIPLDGGLAAVVPALPLAQAIGRWGNWFNQELYGRETGLPWALHITKTPQTPGVFHYQPTFLYESLWCLGVALLCIWAQRRYGLAHGRVFALYVEAYCAGRFWIESLRVDTAHRFFGLRLNDYVSIGVFLLAVAYLVWRRAGKPGGPAQPPSPPHDPALAGVAATEQSAQSAQPNQSAQSAQSAPSARSVPGTDPP